MQRHTDLEVGDAQTTVEVVPQQASSRKPRGLVKSLLVFVVPLIGIVGFAVSGSWSKSDAKSDVASQSYTPVGSGHVDYGGNAADAMLVASETLNAETSFVAGSVTNTKRNIYLGIMVPLIMVSVAVIVTVVLWQQYSADDQHIGEMIEQPVVDAAPEGQVLAEPLQRNSWAAWFLSKHMAVQVLVVLCVTMLLKLLLVIVAIGAGALFVTKELRVESANMEISNDNKLKLSFNANFGSPLWLQFLHLETLGDTLVEVYATTVVAHGAIARVRVPKFALGRGKSEVKFQGGDAITVELADVDLQQVYDDLKLGTNSFKNISQYGFPVQVRVQTDVYSNAILFPIHLKGARVVYSEDPTSAKKPTKSPTDTKLPSFLSFEPSSDPGGRLYLKVSADLSKLRPPVSFAPKGPPLQLASCRLSNQAPKDPPIVDLSASVEMVAAPSPQINLLLALELGYAQLTQTIQSFMKKEDSDISLQLTVFGRAMVVTEKLSLLSSLGKIKQDHGDTQEDVESESFVYTKKPGGKQSFELELYPTGEHLVEAKAIIDLSSKKGIPFIKLDAIKDHLPTKVDIEISGYSGSLDAPLADANHTSLAKASLGIKLGSVEAELTADAGKTGMGRVELAVQVDHLDLDALAKAIIKFFIIEKHPAFAKPSSEHHPVRPDLDGFCPIQRLQAEVRADKFNDLFALLNMAIEARDSKLLVHYLGSRMSIKDALALLPRQGKDRAASPAKVILEKPVGHRLDLQLADTDQHLTLIGDMTLDAEFDSYGDYGFVRWPEIEVAAELVTEATEKGVSVPLPQTLLKMVAGQGSMAYSLDSSLDLMARLHSKKEPTMGGPENEGQKSKGGLSLYVGEASQVDSLVRAVLSILSAYSANEVSVIKNVLSSQPKAKGPWSPKTISLAIRAAKENSKTHTLAVSLPPKDVADLLLASLAAHKTQRREQVSKGARPEALSMLQGTASIAHIDGADIYPAYYCCEPDKKTHSNWTISSKLQTPGLAAGLILLVPMADASQSSLDKAPLAGPDGKRALVPLLSLSVPPITASKLSITSNGITMKKLETPYHAGVLAQTSIESKLRGLAKKPPVRMPLKVSLEFDMPQDCEQLGLDLTKADVAISGPKDDSTYVGKLLQSLHGVPLVELSKLLRPDLESLKLAKLRPQLKEHVARDSGDLVNVSVTVDSDEKSFTASASLGSEFGKIEKGTAPSLALRQEHLEVKLGTAADHMAVSIKDLYIPITPSSAPPRMTLSIKVASETARDSEYFRESMVNFLRADSLKEGVAVESSLETMGLVRALRKIKGSAPSKTILPNTLALAAGMLKKYVARERVVDVSAIAAKDQKGELVKEKADAKQKKRLQLSQLLSVDQIEFLDAVIPLPFKGLWPESGISSEVKKVASVTVAYSHDLVDMVMSRLKPLVSKLATPRPPGGISLSLELKKAIVARVVTVPTQNGLVELAVAPFHHQWDFVYDESPQSPRSYSVNVGLGLNLANPDLMDTLAPIALPLPTYPPHLVFQGKDGKPDDSLQVFRPLTVRFQSTAQPLLDSLIGGILGQVTLHNLYPPKPKSRKSAIDAPAKDETPDFKVSLLAESEKEVSLKLELPESIQLPLTVRPTGVDVALGVTLENKRHEIMAIDVSDALTPKDGRHSVIVRLMNPVQIGDFLNRLLSGLHAEFDLTLQKLKIPILFDPKVSLPEIASRFADSLPAKDPAVVKDKGVDKPLPVFLQFLDAQISGLLLRFGFRPSVVNKFISLDAFLIGAHLGIAYSKKTSDDFVAKVGKEKGHCPDAWKDTVKTPEGFIGKLGECPLRLTGFTQSPNVAKVEGKSWFQKFKDIDISITKLIGDAVLGMLKDNDGVCSNPAYASEVYQVETSSNLASIGTDFASKEPKCVRIKPTSIMELRLGSSFNLPIPLGGINIPIKYKNLWDPCNSLFSPLEQVTNCDISKAVQASSNWQYECQLPSDNSEVWFNRVGGDDNVRFIIKNGFLDVTYNKTFLSNSGEFTQSTKTLSHGIKGMPMRMLYGSSEKQLHVYLNNQYYATVPIDFENKLNSSEYSITVNDVKTPGKLMITRPDPSNTSIYYSQGHFGNTAFYIVLKDENNLSFFSDGWTVTAAKGDKMVDLEASFDPKGGVIRCSSSQLGPGVYTVELHRNETSIMLAQQLVIPDVW